MASQRYWAFLSYTSKDTALVKKLHARLETFRMPRDLIGWPKLDEPIPAKLFPVFRDRDELPLAADLGTTIQDALQASRYLIVICSKNSARSQWVNEEISHSSPPRARADITSGVLNSMSMAMSWSACFSGRMTRRWRSNTPFIAGWHATMNADSCWKRPCSTPRENRSAIRRDIRPAPGLEKVILRQRRSIDRGAKVRHPRQPRGK